MSVKTLLKESVSIAIRMVVRYTGIEPTYIELFAGCGGLSLGLYKAGWKGIFAVEKNADAFATLKYNLIEKKAHFRWPSWLPQRHYAIGTILRKYPKKLKGLRGKVALIAGGPPCQGFSFAGRREERDSRNKLVKDYLKFVQLIQPKIVFFENVKGFTARFSKAGSSGKAYSDYIIAALTKQGYDIHAELVNFADYGVPQSRTRFILVGIKGGNAKNFFIQLILNRPTFLKKRRIPLGGVTLDQAISDLTKTHGTIQSEEFPLFQEGKYGPVDSAYQALMRAGVHSARPDSHRFPNHAPETIQNFKCIMNAGVRNRNVHRLVAGKLKLKKKCMIALAKDEPSPTLTTLPDDYVHYSEPRILTVREYARIQSFYDWFQFQGKYTTGGRERRKDIPRYSQVGNAIPPLFMEQCGVVLRGEL